MSMTIGGLARAGGVGVETIRFYQRRGLLGTPDRGGASGGVRRYGEGDARRLRFIRAAQTAGFTLDEIARLLELDAGTDRAQVRVLARERLAALDDRIAQLQAVRSSLHRLTMACATGDDGPCPIITAFQR